MGLFPIWRVSAFSNLQRQPVLPGVLRGKRVLELGAGTGIAGLAAALLGAQVTARLHCRTLSMRPACRASRQAQGYELLYASACLAACQHFLLLPARLWGGSTSICYVQISMLRGS